MSSAPASLIMSRRARFALGLFSAAPGSSFRFTMNYFYFFFRLDEENDIDDTRAASFLNDRCSIHRPASWLLWQRYIVGTGNIFILMTIIVDTATVTIEHTVYVNNYVQDDLCRFRSYIKCNGIFLCLKQLVMMCKRTSDRFQCIILH